MSVKMNYPAQRPSLDPGWNSTRAAGSVWIEGDWTKKQVALWESDSYFDTSQMHVRSKIYELRAPKHPQIIPGSVLRLSLCGSRSVADVSHSGLFFGPSSSSGFRDPGFAWSGHRTRAPYLAFAVFSQLIAPSPFFFSFFFFPTTPTIVFRPQLGFHSSHIRMETFILRMTSVVNFPIT